MAACGTLSGCSVVMALSGDREPDLEVIRPGAARAHVERELGEPDLVTRTPEGYTLARYGYLAGDEPSLGRAVMHLLLDWMSVFIWELYGMEVEESLSRDARYEHVTVRYDDEGFVVWPALEALRHPQRPGEQTATVDADTTPDD